VTNYNPFSQRGLPRASSLVGPPRVATPHTEDAADERRHLVTIPLFKEEFATSPPLVGPLWVAIL